MESLKVHQELGVMEKCLAMQAWQIAPDYLSVGGEPQRKMKVFPNWNS